MWKCAVKCSLDWLKPLLHFYLLSGIKLGVLVYFDLYHLKCSFLLELLVLVGIGFVLVYFYNNLKKIGYSKFLIEEAGITARFTNQLCHFSHRHLVFGENLLTLSIIKFTLSRRIKKLICLDSSINPQNSMF